MKKKTLFAFILMLALAASAACIGVLAADASAQVYVTVANGALMTAREPVTVTDIDGDGVLTINDALCAVHEKSYDGGAAAGYATAPEEEMLGINALAMPLFGDADQAVGALALVGSIQHVPALPDSAQIAALRRAAIEISQVLGFRGDYPVKAPA